MDPIPLGKTQVEPSLHALQEPTLRSLLFFGECFIFPESVMPTHAIADVSACFFPPLNRCAWYNLLLCKTTNLYILPEVGARSADHTFSASSAYF